MMFNPGDKVLSRERSVSMGVKYYPATIVRWVGVFGNGINSYVVSLEDGTCLHRHENELILSKSKQNNELMEFLLS